jgi:hypothetical protein
MKLGKKYLVNRRKFLYIYLFSKVLNLGTVNK